MEVDFKVKRSWESSANKQLNSLYTRIIIYKITKLNYMTISNNILFCLYLGL